MKLYKIETVVKTFYIFAMSFADAESTINKLNNTSNYTIHIESIILINNGENCLISKQAFDDYTFSEKLENVERVEL